MHIYKVAKVLLGHYIMFSILLGRRRISMAANYGERLVN